MGGHSYALRRHKDPIARNLLSANLLPRVGVATSCTMNISWAKEKYEATYTRHINSQGYQLVSDDRGQWASFVSAHYWSTYSIPPQYTSLYLLQHTTSVYGDLSGWGFTVARPGSGTRLDFCAPVHTTAGALHIRARKHSNNVKGALCILLRITVDCLLFD